jgi:hypothetical protein
VLRLILQGSAMTGGTNEIWSIIAEERALAPRVDGPQDLNTQRQI